jgi:hypothetical protein
MWHYGGSKPLYIGNWILIEPARKTADGSWVRIIFSPNGWLYRDYWRDGEKHELQIIYHPPYPKSTKKKFDIENI